MFSDDGAIGAADDEVAGAMVLSDDGATGAADEDEAAGASDDDEATGAAEDDGASDEVTALDDEVVTVVVVAGPRLKIQIRPMITITTTMMIIQVLRFMG